MSGGIGLSRPLGRFWRLIEVAALALLASSCGRGELWDAFAPPATTTGHDGGLAGGCTAGAACIPANRCELGQTTCVGGVLHCQSLLQPDFSADGQSCQQTGICQAGTCQLCTPGGACTPANVCDLGTVACATGQSSCQDTGAPNATADGTSCGSNRVCSGGACIACSPGASCLQGCLIGSVSCSGGSPSCVNLQPNPGADGLPCPGGVCQAGACVPVSAKRPVFPQIPDQGGSVLGNPQIVTITFQNYPQRAQVEAFGSWVAGSSWLSTVGFDYGVGLGTAVPAVELAFDAPASATEAEVETLLANQIVAGTLPSPSSLGGQGLYLVYYPQGTQLSTGFGNGCEAFRGYHDSFNFQGSDVVFGVVADCPPSSLSEIELVASHEIIEAASDPNPRGEGPPTAWAITDIGSPWPLSIGPEVADLCITLDTHDGPTGFSVQRIWSNSAAKGSGSPCVPAPSAPFFTVSASPATSQQVPIGGSVQYTLTGWSDTPSIGSWTLLLVFGGQFATNPTLSAFTIGNGGTVTLTLSVPSDASANTVGWVAVQSIDAMGQVVSIWPVAVIAQ